MGEFSKNNFRRAKSEWAMSGEASFLFGGGAALHREAIFLCAEVFSCL
jgi:hypothetical protein